MLAVALFIGAYVFGGVPFGYLVAKAKGVDIMHAGSGNIGATNVMRVLGPRLGTFVFVLDVLKGFAPALAAYLLIRHAWPWSKANPSAADTAELQALVVGLGAVGGHCASPFLKFKGGKGVATALGVLFGVCPMVALSALGLWSFIFGLSGYVSLSSVVAAASLAPLGYLFHVQPILLDAFGALGLFVVYRHRANLLRLKNGTEPNFRVKKNAEARAEKPKTGLNLLTAVLFLLVGSGMMLGALSTLVR